MLIKIFTLLVLSVYIVLAYRNILDKDSSLLIEKFYKFLKNLYYHFY